MSFCHGSCVVSQSFTVEEQGWGGLEHRAGATTSLMDGSVNLDVVNTGTWWFAIGNIREHNGGIPGPNIVVDSVELWVKKLPIGVTYEEIPL